MADLVDINELKKQMAEKLTSEEWQVFATSQTNLIESLQKENAILKQKNAQLEHLLVQRTPTLVQELSPEEVICIQQIDKLHTASQTRELSLEEVKRLDLLVKNLKLIREESTIVVNNNRDSLKEHELVAIINSDPGSNSNA